MKSRPCNSSRGFITASSKLLACCAPRWWQLGGAAFFSTLLLPALLLAQEQTGDSASATPNGQKSSPPPLPLSKSPVEIFRELLAQNPAERAAFLAKRTPESQKLIVAKLQEYESLPPEQCELRLQVTELRWYLLPLMKAPVASRSEELGRIPEGPRKLVQDRLGKWDKLPAEVQKQV